MYRLVWPAILLLLTPLLLTACGGKSAGTLTVTCAGAGGAQLFGATSIDVLGDAVNGRPTMNFPDPSNPSKTGSISVEPHGHCTITPPS
jgi:hypothetical protein